MSFLFTQLGRYLLLHTLGGVLLTLGGVSATILLVDVVEQLRTVGARSGVSLLGALQLTALRTPQLIEQTLPFVVLTGTMVALARLNRRNELTVIRASGVSVWRFLAPTATAAFVIGLAATTLLSPIASWTDGKFEQQKAMFLKQFRQSNARTGIWLRQGDATQQIVIQADRADPSNASLHDATFFFFDRAQDDTLTFTHRISAERADLRGGFWQLSKLVDAAPAKPAAHIAHLAIPTTIRPSALLDRIVSPNTLSFWALPSFINGARKAGLAPVRYEFRWQRLLAQPALLAAMAALGAVFSLRLQRLGGAAQWALLGGAFGFALFFFGQLLAALAVTQAASTVLAAWAPPLVGFFGALAVLSYQEDG